MIVGLYRFFGNLLIACLILANVLLIGELLSLLFSRGTYYSALLVKVIKMSIIGFVATLPIVLILDIFV